MLPLVNDEYIMAVLSPLQITSIKTELEQSRGFISKQKISELKSTFNCELEQLLKALLPVAASFSQAPISDFNVGAIAYDAVTESAFMGANLEFAHQALNLAVHAEQAAINNAWMNGAKSIDLMVITDAPCGHCRQFMNEIEGAETLKVLLPNIETTLSNLLPHSFGPKDLGNQRRLLSEQNSEISAKSSKISDDLRAQLALAYAPYSKNPSAVEIVTVDHGRFYGRYAENVAYNPSLPPMQSALSQLALAGLSLNDVEIKSITLVEFAKTCNQKAVADAVLASYQQDLDLRHVLLD